MQYNTARGQLVLREYGRVIQELIQNAHEIPAERRQQYMESVAVLMLKFDNPTSQMMDDARQKVWSHIMHLGGFELGIVPPVDVQVEQEKPAPKPMRYPKRNYKYLHYGQNIRRLIEKARETEDPYKRAMITETIAAYMKMSYKTWNKDNVTDKAIIEDVRVLSGNELQVPDNAFLDAFIHPRKFVSGANSVAHQNKQPQHLLAMEALRKKKKKKKKTREGGYF